jgi:hypothetical protein
MKLAFLPEPKLDEGLGRMASSTSSAELAGVRSGNQGLTGSFSGAER